MRASLAVVLAALAFVSTGAAATKTFEPLYPNVSPDGVQLAWVEGATSRLVVANADGSGAHTLAVAPTGEVSASSRGRRSASSPTRTSPSGCSHQTASGGRR